MSTEEKKKRQKNDGLRKRCDCSWRSWPKCKHAWWMNFKHGDTHHRISLDKHLGRHIDRKADAEDEAAEIKKAIKAGTFGMPAPIKEMTYRQLAKLYLEDVEVRNPRGLREARYASDMVCRTIVPLANGKTAGFGDLRIDDITTHMVETFRKTRIKAGAGVVGVNRQLRTIRQTYRWGIVNGLTDRTPFKLNGESVIKLAKENPRNRRLAPGEEERILAVSGTFLTAVVVAAIETAMRKGEITSLQWYQVEGMETEENQTVTWRPKAEIFLPLEKTKTKRDRRIPISRRLKALLEMRRFDPNGEPHARDAYVFGTEIGTRVVDFGRAWEYALLKANGHKPVLNKKTNNLAPESRAILQNAIGLHFHDLRREAGSRWMDGGVPLATIQRWLGHSNISQTSTYLGGSDVFEHEHMRRYEERVQQRATEVETGGRKSPSEATATEEMPNKTTDRHDRTM